MADQTIREAERRWRETGDAAAGVEYLRALERAGLLSDQTPIDIPTVAPPITVECGRNRAVIGIPGVGRVLMHYQTPVAAVVDGPGADVWSPEAAYSASSERVVREWFADQRRDIVMAEEVSAESLVDLLRLVPISEFWPTCDGCLERRQEVTHQRDGLNLCAACAPPVPAFVERAARSVAERTGLNVTTGPPPAEATPHFNGTMPHRYEDGVCVYCAETEAASRNPAMVACPYCAAAQRMRCQTITGRCLPYGSYHRAREQAIATVEQSG